MLYALIMQSFGQGLLSRQSRTHYVLEKSFYRGLFAGVRVAALCH